MKKVIKFISKIMNEESLFYKFSLFIVIAGVLVLSVMALDNIIDLIRFLFNYEHLVIVSPIVALAIMFYSQAKYPLDKTIKYSDYAKKRM